MKELVGKLTALDPEAGDALKVVGYFDTLIDGRVGVESLLRGAATLSGVPAGYRKGAIAFRVLPDGSRAPAADPGGYPIVAAGIDAIVWLERPGLAHANDNMVRERLAVAIAQSGARGGEQTPERHAIELLLTSNPDEETRISAEAHLRLDPTSRFRAVAFPCHTILDNRIQSTVLATRWGLVRGAILEADESVTGTAGVGVSVVVSELQRSWRTALVALALCDEATPTFCADDLGTLVFLAGLISDSSTTPADVLRIDDAMTHSWSFAALQAIADGKSVRAVAAEAGLHHSSVHARLPELGRLLDYDPITPLGRTRLYASLALHRVVHARFDAF